MENKLMMKLVVGTEAMFFLCLIMVFIYFSLVPGFTTEQIHSPDIKSTAIFSVLLFSSSFTFWRAEKNFNHGRLTHFKIWLLITIFLGIVFLFGQGREYAKLLESHVTIGSSTFGTSFFTLTGFHGLHVFAGLVILSIVAILAFLGDYNNSKSTVVSTVGIYWHFVDIVWAVVFFIVYVAPRLFKI